MRTSKIKKKFENALNSFIAKYKKNQNVIGIIVSGSYIHSIPDKNSDIDVYILLDKSEVRERGNTFVDGVEIEYFINPVKEVRHYFATEIGKKAPSTAHMFANSRVLYKKGDNLDVLIREAKKIVSSKQEKMSKFEIEFTKYFIDDMQKDLEDVYLKKDNFAFELIAGEIIAKCLETFFKVKRKQKEKSKRLLKQLLVMDSEFGRIFCNSVTEKEMRKKFQKLNKLISYTEKLIGGKRPKEWKIVSRCSYISK